MMKFTQAMRQNNHIMNSYPSPKYNQLDQITNQDTQDIHGSKQENMVNNAHNKTTHDLHQKSNNRKFLKSQNEKDILSDLHRQQLMVGKPKINQIIEEQIQYSKNQDVMFPLKINRLDDYLLKEERIKTQRKGL